MRRFLGATGRVLVTGGLLLLLFVAYQLWGTGIYEARAQNRLKDQFNAQLRHHGRPTTTGPTTVTTQPNPTTRPATATTEPSPTVATPPTTTTLAPAPSPDNGDAVARIQISKIGLDAFVIEGVDVDNLRQGPGHYPGTPLPGQEGNVAIAGHRTTYGAPFGDLDQLGEGDEITLVTVQGVFHYRVDQAPFAVDPGDRDVLRPQPDPARPGHDAATLTLTTCTPKYSAAQRLVATATLEIPQDQTPLPAVTSPKAVVHTISGLSGERSSRTPALFWGLFAAAVGALWWLLFHRHPRLGMWFVGVIPFLVVLFVFYTYLERMLPSNY